MRRRSREPHEAGRGGGGPGGMNTATTPMMAQYRRIRSEVPAGTILFFRLGDFYEMFFEDAVEASRILDLTLTHRQKMPMCGVPYHAAEGYIARLLAAGRKVAICDQMENPAVARGLVRRDVTRIVTPGTLVDEPLLEAGRNNYLAAVCVQRERLGLAMLEMSTGTFWVEEPAHAAALKNVMAQFTPVECVVPREQADAFAYLRAGGAGPILSPMDDWVFQPDNALDRLHRHFGVHSMDGFGCGGLTSALGAAGAVLQYVADDLRRAVTHVRGLAVRHSEDYMLLDESTLANLELVASRNGPSGPTLLKVMDATCTPMGSRLLRDWLIRPLISAPAIRRRQDAVEALTRDRAHLRTIRERLDPVRDLERLVGRLSAGSGSARDVRAVAISLERLPELREAATGAASPRFQELAEAIEPRPDLLALINRALVDEPPLALKEGGVIRPGYNAELDDLRAAATQGREWLAKYQVEEQEKTGIASLKVRHNKVFGFYIEITKANLDRAPERYIRKQTLVNAERFITPELKDYENRILGAQERSVELEYALFQEVREAVVRETASLQRTAAALAELDVLAALADRAVALRYVRPEIHEDTTLRIRDGRHPVIEQLPEADRFVPNDTLLDGDGHRLVILTGPNMAGKSTYIRQVALLVIMAQTGAFIPASAAEIGLVDRVFTRVGASDDLARGRSTFMVEMQETASILHNATSRSLIILDEIGRGTSTFDGISIAWAVAEYVHNEPRLGARTLFATHYHELTDLTLTLPGAKNYNVQVRESGDHVVFLRKIAPGPAEKSFGIQVARMAGLPPAVIERSKEIIANLEEGEFEAAGQPKIARRRTRKPVEREDAGRQMSLF